MRELSLAKEPSLRKPKYKISKNGTITVACKGSHQMIWYREREAKDIPECLKNFCSSCDHHKPDCEAKP